MKKVIFLFLLFFHFYNNPSAVFSVEPTIPEFKFLQNIKDLTANFKQTDYYGKKPELSDGKIVIKKPDSILLEHNSKEMKLKIVSINGNLKMIDQDLGQTTYIDNKYTELMQFFTKNLKPESLTLNNNRELCMRFEHMDNTLEACLKLDVNKYTIQYIRVYAIDETTIENKIKQYKNTKRYLVMNIEFSQVNINHGVDDDEFFIKDNRIFGEDD